MTEKELKPEMNFINYRGITLYEGRTYKWSGNQRGLYNDVSWNKLNCKIIQIEGNTIFIKQSIFSNNPKSVKGTPDETTSFTKDNLEAI